MAGVCEFLRRPIVGVCELVAVLARVSLLLFCQEANGWYVLVRCCSVRRPMAGVCELVVVLSEGQWLLCLS